VITSMFRPQSTNCS